MAVRVAVSVSLALASVRAQEEESFSCADDGECAGNSDGRTACCRESHTFHPTGDGCFDPLIDHCAVQDSGSYTAICPLQKNTWCVSGPCPCAACYDDSTEVCSEIGYGSKMICPRSASLVCQHECHSPDAGVCCSHGSASSEWWIEGGNSCPDDISPLADTTTAPPQNGICTTTIQSELLFGCDQDANTHDAHALADRICCHNTDFAEYSGYFRNIAGGAGLFSQLDSSGVTTFHDSVCGKPLFRAPVGRSFEEWQEESNHHGWPSFREAEMVAENVEIRSNGEMRSTCGTHLGHNLPDGADRYCIDLVCIAGSGSSNAALAI